MPDPNRNRMLLIERAQTGVLQHDCVAAQQNTDECALCRDAQQRESVPNNAQGRGGQDGTPAGVKPKSEFLLGALGQEPSRRVSFPSHSARREASSAFDRFLRRALSYGASQQGPCNRVIEAIAASTNGGQGRFRRRQRVGGLLSFHYHDGA